MKKIIMFLIIFIFALSYTAFARGGKGGGHGHGSKGHSFHGVKMVHHKGSMSQKVSI
jgi:hypothetical protein